MDVEKEKAFNFAMDHLLEVEEKMNDIDVYVDTLKEDLQAICKDKVSDRIFAALEQDRVGYQKAGLGAMAQDCHEAALAFRKVYMAFRKV